MAIEWDVDVSPDFPNNNEVIEKGTKVYKGGFSTSPPPPNLPATFCCLFFFVIIMIPFLRTRGWGRWEKNLESKVYFLGAKGGLDQVFRSTVSQSLKHRTCTENDSKVNAILRRTQAILMQSLATLEQTQAIFEQKHSIFKQRQLTIDAIR